MPETLPVPAYYEVQDIQGNTEFHMLQSEKWLLSFDTTPLLTTPQTPSAPSCVVVDIPSQSVQSLGGDAPTVVGDSITMEARGADLGGWAQTGHTYIMAITFTLDSANVATMALKIVIDAL